MSRHPLALGDRIRSLAVARRAEAVQEKSLLPKNGALAAHFVQWGDNQAVELASRRDPEAAAVALYVFAAMRWRAEKLAEAGLTVAQVDSEDGSEEWLPNHPMAGILEEPHPEFDMASLLVRTSYYADATGGAIWVVDQDRAGRPVSLMPFSQREYEVISRDGRIFAAYKVRTGAGEETIPVERVVPFAEQHPRAWTRGLSIVDLACDWLALGERARQTVWDLLHNAVWPSIVSIPDKEWNPNKEGLDAYKEELRSYGRQKGQPFVALGGGQVQIVMPPIKDLVPSDILSRVETAVAVASGVPAIVLQFQVGMENSPWSQMEQARRMAYDDTIQPRWRRWERIITRSLLRPEEPNRAIVVRFDRTGIAALQTDRTQAATQASLLSSIATLNERRAIVELEPIDDPAADEVPEIANRAALRSLPGFGGPAAGGEDEEEEEGEEEGGDEEEREQKAVNSAYAQGRRIAIAPKGRRGTKTGRMEASIRRVQLEASQFAWEANVAALLEADRATIDELASRLLVEEEKTPTSPSRKRFMAAVGGYLKGEARARWRRALEPLAIDTASRGAEYVAADLLIDFALLQPGAVDYALKEVGFLIKQVTETTRKAVADVIARGLAEGSSVQNIARQIAEAGGFGRDRAKLIARTEVARTQNGAAVEAVKDVSRRTGVRYEKVWRSALDDRVRDEHLELEGEVAELGAEFSNGREFPDEPNCRCVALIREVE